MSDARDSMENVSARVKRTHTKFTIVRIQHGHVHDQPEALGALPNVVAVNTHPGHPHVMILQGEISDAEISSVIDDSFEAEIVTGNSHPSIPFPITVR